MNPHETDDKKTILIVEDSTDTITPLIIALRDKYNVKIALDGEAGLERIEHEGNPDIILLDIGLGSGMNGYQICQKLKKDPRTKQIPVIFVTVKDNELDEEKGLSYGAVDYINKPVCVAIAKKRIETQLKMVDYHNKLTKKVEEKAEKLNKSYEKIIRCLSQAVEFRDGTTGSHVIRVGEYARVIALKMGHSEKEANLILNAALMHDIGKIGVSDAVLKKKGAYTSDDRRLIEAHPDDGASIIGEPEEDDPKLIKYARECALYHHECWDGTGYPRGLKETEIPWPGRVVAIADVFDALTSERPYKPAEPVEVAAEKIRAGRGKQFDPHIVDIFFEVLPEIVKIKDKYT